MLVDLQNLYIVAAPHAPGGIWTIIRARTRCQRAGSTEDGNDNIVVLKVMFIHSIGFS